MSDIPYINVAAIPPSCLFDFGDPSPIPLSVLSVIILCILHICYLVDLINQLIYCFIAVHSFDWLSSESGLAECWKHELSKKLQIFVGDFYGSILNLLAFSVGRQSMLINLAFTFQ